MNKTEDSNDDLPNIKNEPIRMAEIKREDLQIISRHSNLSGDSINKILTDKIYSSVLDWRKFLRLFSVSLGIGFITTGIVFFFAYNWDGLHKFTKLGLIEGLIILIAVVILTAKIKVDIKNIMLAGAAMLVGVLFAVFGQIYQTGSNAYDFFLGWTLFISLWVIISNFAPLWLIYFTLINTTLVLYANQVAHDWSEVFTFTLLFLLNIIFYGLSRFVLRFSSRKTASTWLSKTAALAAVTSASIGIIIGIFNEFPTSLLVLISLTLIVYAAGVLHSLATKTTFILALIAFSIIIIFSALFFNISVDAAMILLVGLFVVGGITLTIKFIIHLQNKWDNE